VNLLGRVYQLRVCLKAERACLICIKAVFGWQPVNLFYGLYTTNLSAHHACITDDGTTSHLGANDMSLGSLMNSLLAAYAHGTTGAACEFSRPE
jgi:hypothetical protein